MKQPGSHYLMPVIGPDYLWLGRWYANMAARIDGATGVGLSAPQGTKPNIEEVDRAGIPSVCVMAMVGCLEERMLARM